MNESLLSSYCSMRKQPKERPAPEELMVSEIFFSVLQQSLA